MIYTGYFAKLRVYENAGLQPLSIAGRAPEFYKGPQYKVLAPRLQMFNDWKKGKIDNNGYTEIFSDYLNSLDKESVRRALTAFDNDVILLCYEKPGDFCHRHIVAKWIENNLGMPVDEYDQVAKDNESQAINDLKDFYLSESLLANDYMIKDVKKFLQRLEENPPEGYFLYKKIVNNNVEYTLENKEEFLKSYGL